MWHVIWMRLPCMTAGSWCVCPRSVQWRIHMWSVNRFYHVVFCLFVCNSQSLRYHQLDSQPWLRRCLRTEERLDVCKRHARCISVNNWGDDISFLDLPAVDKLICHSLTECADSANIATSQALLGTLNTEGLSSAKQQIITTEKWLLSTTLTKLADDDFCW